MLLVACFVCLYVCARACACVCVCVCVYVRSSACVFTCAHKTPPLGYREERREWGAMNPTLSFVSSVAPITVARQRSCGRTNRSQKTAVEGKQREPSRGGGDGGGGAVGRRCVKGQAVLACVLRLINTWEVSRGRGMYSPSRCVTTTPASGHTDLLSAVHRSVCSSVLTGLFAAVYRRRRERQGRR